MAKKPVKPSSGPRPASSGETSPAAPSAAGASAKSPEDSGGNEELAGELSVSADELDEIERRLNARLAGSPSETEGLLTGTDGRPRSESTIIDPTRTETEPESNAEPASDARDRGIGSRPAPAVSPGKSPEAADADRRKPGGRGFGSAEWMALGGFGLVAMVAAALFFKYLYGHPGPLQGPGLPKAFVLPMASGNVRLIGAEAGWRERRDGDKAQAEEVVLPTIALTLDPSAASKGFVRVEFLDTEGKIRGDVLTVALEGGRFQEGGRGEVIEEGGQKVHLTCTVGFRTRPLFTSYLTGEEPRWSVRLKEGPDSSNGPWTDLGAALIPNIQL